MWRSSTTKSKPNMNACPRSWLASSAAAWLIGARGCDLGHGSSARLRGAPSRAWRFLFGRVRRVVAHAVGCHPALHVFGFTARHDNSGPIAGALLQLVRELSRKLDPGIDIAGEGDEKFGTQTGAGPAKVWCTLVARLWRVPIKSSLTAFPAEEQPHG
jgi:hypothetical protein